MAKKSSLSFTEGTMFWKMLLFALPIMATGMMQTLYSIADNIIVGQFSGDPNALGAVGSTSSLTYLSINMLIGISAGTSVVVSQAFGAKNEKMVSKAVHTALITGFFGGIIFMILGLLASKPALVMIGTRPELLDGAVLYFRIICIGIPATAMYNFGAAILRSVGDSKTPLIVLSTTGIANVGLNLFFVIACKMSVAGVAIATIVSQYLSAIAVISVLFFKRNECYGFSPSKLAFDSTLFLRIIRFGIPSGIQSSIFSFANVLLTSGVNSLGSNAIKAYTIASNIDNITYQSCVGFHHASLTFTGQNFGAKKPERIKKAVLLALFQVIVVNVLIAQTELLFADPLISLYINNSDVNKAEITAIAKDIMKLILNTYFICGIMDVLSGAMKGLGYSIIPMILSITFVCGFRVFWRFFVFPLPAFNSTTGLMLCFIISWALTALSFVPFVIAKIVKMSRKKEA